MGFRFKFGTSQFSEGKPKGIFKYALSFSGLSNISARKFMGEGV